MEYDIAQLIDFAEVDFDQLPHSIKNRLKIRPVHSEQIRLAYCENEKSSRLSSGRPADRFRMESDLPSTLFEPFSEM